MEAEAAPDGNILGIPYAKNPHPMWIYDRETFAFLDVNDAAIKAYGFSRREFLAMTIRDVRPVEDIPELLRKTQRPRPKGQSTGEKWRHIARDGTVFPVMITSWELTFRDRPAELVLARREDPE